MNILFIEPYYEGSHKYFADELKKHSKHKIVIWKTSGHHWKWRMQGSAIYFANKFKKCSTKFDLIIATDMINYSLFISLIKDALYNGPYIIYFHENQFAYPTAKNQTKDLSYPFINYISALSADYCLFNSKYNLDTFIKGAKSLLKKMPDYENLKSVDSILEKSKILPLGMKYPPIIFDKKNKTDKCNILWNHRWEHDKNPELFFNSLISLSNLDFNLYVTGKSSEIYPQIFDIAYKKLKNKISFWGRVSDYKKYISILNQCNLLPVTSIHDFFGISVMEAIHYGVHPLLPKRLSYIDLYNPLTNPDIFYNNNNDFKTKLREKITKYSSLENFSKLTAKYSWENMIIEYDNFFESL